MTSIIKSLFSGLLVGIFALSIFIPAFQAQAALGTVCNEYADSVCTVGGVVYSCNGLVLNQSGVATTNGKCGGPCVGATRDADCQTSVGSPLGWGAAKCTGTTTVAGSCMESPREGSRLPDTAPAATGEELLAILNTATNWIFAIFAILSIIFVLLAALQFISAGGDAAKVGEARQKLIWAAIGIAVALASKGLVPIVKNIIGA